MERTIAAALGTGGTAAGIDVSGAVISHDLAWIEPGPGSEAGLKTGLETGPEAGPKAGPEAGARPEAANYPSPLARAIQRLLAEHVQQTEWVVGWSSCLLPPPPDLAP